MNRSNKWIFAFGAICAWSQAAVLCAQSTDPSTFTTITELLQDGGSRPITNVYKEVSDHSAIQIAFEEKNMLPPDSGSRRVLIRVEAFLVKGTSSIRVPTIDNYFSSSSSDQDRPGTFHDKAYDPSIGARIVPDTIIDLLPLDVASYDSIVIRVTNRQTQESLERHLLPRPFGFRSRVSDSLLFVRRLGVTDQEQSEGVDDFNFGPTPGVAYTGTFLARENGFLRFLRPGVGLNVSFMDWDDPAFDVATGQFSPGADSSDIEIGMGIQVSLFNNMVHATYGWNLQAEQDRSYFGVGVSFVNITTRLRGLLAPGEEDQQ